MKTLFIFALCQLMIFVAPFSQLLAAEPAPAVEAATVVSDSTHITAEQGHADGSLAATDHYRSGKWIGYGLGGGFLLGLIGAGVVLAVSQAGRPRPNTEDALHISNGTPQYQLSYGDAYAKQSKKKALGRVLIGSLIGTAAAVAVVSAAQK